MKNKTKNTADMGTVVHGRMYRLCVFTGSQLHSSGGFPSINKPHRLQRRFVAQSLDFIADTFNCTETDLVEQPFQRPFCTTAVRVLDDSRHLVNKRNHNARPRIPIAFKPRRK